VDDLRIVAARLWYLVGRKPVPAKDLEVVLYRELSWFPPTQAEQVVRLLQQAKLLRPGPTAGTLVAAPEVESMEVPITYRPPAALPSEGLAGPSADLLSRILAELAGRSRTDEAALRKESERLAYDLELTPEAAALLVGWRQGISLPELRDEVARRLASESHAA
jgi:hypothetical protein